MKLFILLAIIWIFSGIVMNYYVCQEAVEKHVALNHCWMKP